MQFSEAQQWLKTLGIKCRITEETWQKMDEQTRSVFMSDARMASGKGDVKTCREGMDGYALVDKAQWRQLVDENARLKRELSNANREFDRVTGWGYSVLAAQPALMDVTATLP